MEELNEDSVRGCGVCGSTTVEIRGRYPKTPRRVVCPTCLADRMDDINKLSNIEYGIAQAADTPVSEPKICEDPQSDRASLWER